MENNKLTADYYQNIRTIDKILRVNESFDIIKKEMEISGHKLTFYYIDGFINSGSMQKLMNGL